MSKKQSPSSSSSPSDNEVYQVQKIVNQRIINGKKQYKVIWAGYSFEEATWQPEENLRCPEKINQFIRRYQDVIRRKNLLNKNLTESNVQIPTKNRSPQIQKVSIQKGSIPSKPLSSQPSILNKERLQISLQKTLNTSQKKIPDYVELKQKVMGPHSSSEVKKTGPNFNQYKVSPQTSNEFSNTKNQNVSPVLRDNKITISQAKNSSGSIKNMNTEAIEVIDKPQGTKVIKIQNQSQSKSDQSFKKIQSKIESKLESQFQYEQPRQPDTKKSQVHLDETYPNNITNIAENFKANDIIEERKIGSNSSQSQSLSEQSQTQRTDQNIFLNVNERLEVQTIFGAIYFDKQNDSKTLSSAQNFLQEPHFFLVKNRFSQHQRIVEKQRLIRQQPMQLINFYEDLLSKSHE